jgi:tetratricopeptide (TPR) repeat protein
MLFDLRSAGRRRTVKGVYLGLALLMFVGFVGFSVGSSGLSGGIVDAITGSGGGGGGTDNSSQERLTASVRTADAKAKAAPSDANAWKNVAQARLRLSNVGDNFDAKTSDYTAAGKRQLTAAGAAWDKYLALKPTTPDESVARQMIQAYIAIGQPDKAVSTQEVLTELEPSQQTFQNLAILAYQAGNLRKGDLAAGKAVDMAPKDAKKDLKGQLDQYKQQAAQQQIQQLQPTPTPTIG